MLRARSPLLHFRVSLPTQPLPRPAGVIRGAYTGAVQAYLTFSLALEVELPTSKAREKRPGARLDIFYQTAHFFWLKMCLSLSPAQTLLRNAKLSRGCQNYRKFCFKHQRCSKVSQVF